MYSHPLSGDHSVTPARLVVSITLDLAIPVHLNTTKDILGPCNTSKVRNTSVIADMNESSSSTAASTSLPAGGA